VIHHGAALARESGRPELDEAVASGDWKDFDERMLVLLDYALKLTVRPWQMAEEDVRALRDVGLTDRDIVDANQVVAYFNYVNRVADGLGVELEDRWPVDLRPERRYGLGR
jgi:uncharacterized peroxidase-related enzyme